MRWVFTLTLTNLFPSTLITKIFDSTQILLSSQAGRQWCKHAKRENLPVVQQLSP